MAGFVDDLLRDAQQTGRALSTSAASLLHTAQAETSSLFQFHNGKLSGPLAAKFGTDPVVFFNNAIKSNVAFWVAVTNDVAARAGRTSYKVADPKSGKNVDVPAKIKTSTPFPVLALVVCLASVNHPDLFLDAAGRRASGVGGGKGIDDVYWWPASMAVAQGAGTGPGPGHGVVGFDDVIIGLVGLATAILGIGAVVLPVLISGVGFVVKQVTNATKPPDQPAPQGESVGGIPIPLILVGVALLIGVVLLWKPKAKAAG